ncbi:hypothetical protein NP233_g5496 [Leucocoprinus birnbaumii]|uniref:Cell division control protein 14 n=1 Tax=Leucocoprinus birnbaumii TaxID=56174 RepID=A0AAD5YUJ7_9AGAR|nr:hypothetical protein NP233_g5496 [Leucocoprinus birnbaumii]
MRDKKDEPKESWDHFLALQYTFECNVASRLLSWISVSTAELEQAVNKGSSDERTLTSQLARALCIIQGVTLSHDATKTFLGRKYSLEVLTDLLLASRHLNFPPEEDRSGSAQNKQPIDVPLTSTILDTFLCVLVDSPSALRAFESVHGVQVVVRILKRAGTPREARMKCLEFLYFYLLDETVPPKTVLCPRSRPTSPTLSAALNTPSFPGTPTLQQPRARLPKPSLNRTPLRPLSRHGSGSSAFSSSSSSRSTSGGSSQSFSSISSISTPASSIPSSPDKPNRLSQFQSSFRTAPQTPQSSFKFPNAQSRHDMMMLRKDVDYEPLSPRKPGSGERTSTPSFRPRAHTHGQLHTPSRTFTHSTTLSISVSDNDFPDNGDNEKRKTTDEKKQFLGTMLGNVDALVEGVRRAGIWGLG